MFSSGQMTGIEKKILYIILFFGYFSSAQFQCPRIEKPLNGAKDVAVDTRVSWNTVGGIGGYSVSLGTSPGSSDILNSRSAALVNFLEPAIGLPDNTEIFVTISLFLDNGNFVTCPSESFTTVDIITPPGCTTLNGPLPNAQNVKLGEMITWAYAPTATGYRLTIGTSEGGSEVLPETDLGNVLNYDPPENLPVNSNIFVKLVPYNDNGTAQNCVEQSFVTGDSNIDCEQFRPEITVPETIGLCQNGSEITISSEDIAKEFRWFMVNDDDTERLISEARSITVSDFGRYRYEAYNKVSIFGDEAECTSSSYFSIVASEMATVEAVEVDRDALGIRLTILVSGSGNYEYAIDKENGLFQDSNVFSSVSDGDHLIYIRDKNGCGVSEYTFIQTLTKNDFPNFFTPNNDGTNDYWQFDPLFGNRASLSELYIFDRFGKLLIQLNPESIGWDGTFRGTPVPSSTYWYKAVAKNDDVVQGYFALKR